MRFHSTDLPKLLIGSLIEHGFTAYQARILSRRLLGQSNSEIANALDIKKSSVANEVSQNRIALDAFAHSCHDCTNAPRCEDYSVLPDTSATVCDNFDPMEELQ